MIRAILILLLLLPLSLQAQFAPFGAWKTGPTAAPADTAVTNIDSLVMRYVADDIIDSLGKSDGDTTYIWKNRVAERSSLYQTTDALKPIIRDSSGVRWLKFDGVNDYLKQTVSPLYSQPLAIFAIIKLQSRKTTTMLSDGAGASNRVVPYIWSNTAWSIFAGANSSANTIGDDTLYVFVGNVNGGATMNMLNNNTKVGTPGAQGLAGLTIGADNAGNNSGDWYIYEYNVYHKFLTELEIANLKYYANTKYGTPLP